MGSLRYLAIDFGQKKIGLAGSGSGIIVTPLEVIIARRNSDLLVKTVEKIRHYNPEEIVIGLPLDSQGRETKQAHKVYIFYNTLKSIFKNIKFHFSNEFLSTVEAQHRMGKKPVRQDDRYAAAVILEQFLNQINRAQSQN